MIGLLRYKSLYIGVGIVAAATTFLLTGCESNEEKSIKYEKRQLDIVYTYDYDTTRVVVDEEKTISELAKELMLENVGLDSGIKKYAPVGVQKDQGIFIESAIRDGDAIPKVSAMSKEDIALLGKGDDDDFTEMKKEAFENLKSNREKVLDEQYADDSQDQRKLEEELEKRVEEQKKRIAEQEKALEEQNS